MATGPAGSGHEPPDEELPGTCAQPLDRLAAQVQGHHGGCLGDDSINDEAVPPGAQRRQAETEDDDGGGRGGVDRPPVHPCPRGRGEVRAGPQLVWDGQAHPEVGVQVQQVPGFVAQPPSGRAHRGHDDHHQHRGPRRRQQHAGIVGDELPCLRHQAGPGRRRVTQSDQHDVGEHQIERGETDQTMTPGELILAVAAFHPGNARHQQHLDE